MKVLVIEDEIPAQEELVRILRKHFPNIEIVDIIGSVRDSVEWLRNNTTDLILWTYNSWTAAVLTFLM